MTLQIVELVQNASPNLHSFCWCDMDTVLRQGTHKACWGGETLDVFQIKKLVQALRKALLRGEGRESLPCLLSPRLRTKVSAVKTWYTGPCRHPTSVFLLQSHGKVLDSGKVLALGSWGCLFCSSGRAVSLDSVDTSWPYGCPVCAGGFGSGPLHQSFQLIFLLLADKGQGLTLCCGSAQPKTLPLHLFTKDLQPFFVFTELKAQHWPIFLFRKYAVRRHLVLWWAPGIRRWELRILLKTSRLELSFSIQHCSSSMNFLQYTLLMTVPWQ